MSKSFKSFALTLALLAAVVVPACQKKKPVVAPSATFAPASTVPDIPLTVTTATAQTVTEPTDFVKPSTDTVATEVLPNDIGELNRVAQSRGYIADALF
jgi:hypothetical protein